MNRTCEEILARASEPQGLMDAAVRTHLEFCASCREAARVLAALYATRSEPSTEALVRLRARLDGPRARPRRRPWVGAALAGGLAAAAAAAALAVLPMRHPERVQGGASSAPAPGQVAGAAHSYDESWLTMTDADWSAETQYDGASTILALMDFTQ